MGFDEARLEALNTRLITASVNGYGSTGPYVDRPAFDFIAQAMSGFMAVNGDPDGPPRRAAPPVSDLIAGLYCAFGVTSALEARPRTGRGQKVESSPTGGRMAMMAYLSARSEEHTSELQSLMRISYAVFCLKKKNTTKKITEKTVRK